MSTHRAVEEKTGAPDNTDSPAVAVAKAHVEAWSHHDWNAARKMLAKDVRVDVTTPLPIMKPTHTTGVEAYMEGLIQFAQGIEPGSARFLGSIGDATNSLILLTVRVAFGPGAPLVTLPAARLAVLDESRKIKAEQVIFFALGE